jgi:tetratricopeptide (TPR) repeat protein
LFGGIGGFLAFSCLAPHANAQDRAELSTLIFEPVLLSAEPVAKSDSAVSNDAAPTTESTASDLDVNTDPKNPEAAVEDADLSAPTQNTLMLRAQIQRYRDSISSLSNSADSPYSDTLREQNYSLALLLAQDGDYAGAIPVLEAAMHIDRINQGLFTPRQVELVNQLIQNHARLGHYEQVANYEEYLYYIQTKSYAPDDPQRIAATERWADWNVESFLQTGPEVRYYGNALSLSSGGAGGLGYVPVQSQSGMVYYMPRAALPATFGGFGAPGGLPSSFALQSSGYAISPELLVDERLTRAEDIYEKLGDTQGLSAERKAALQRKEANVAFTVKRQMDAMGSSFNQSASAFNSFAPDPINPVVNRVYRDSKDSLEVLAQQTEADPNASSAAKAQAYMDLGDWHLSFERFGPAAEAYHKAWELAGSPMDTEPTLHPVLHPDYLVPVPTFVQHPYSREFYGIKPTAQLDYKGHVDMTVEIDRRGQVTPQNILAASADASQALRRTLLDYLRNNRMRPFLRNGETTNATLNLRFYYTY